MDESAYRMKFQIQELNLIDVSIEDDSLINFSCSEKQEHKHVRFLDPFDSGFVEDMFNSLEEEEQGGLPLGSSELEKGKSGKCNLRQSLACDKAFFSSEGFLEPKELSSMNGVTKKNNKRVLPASIQKSSNESNVGNSNNKKKLGAAGSETNLSSKNVELASRQKMTPKVALKKSNVGTQDSGKATKQVSVRPQASQSVASNKESTRSPSKPPKVVGKVSPIATISTKRTSLAAKCNNLEKDNSRTASDRGAPAPKLSSPGSSRTLVPRPTPSSKSLNSLAATKTRLTACSSLDSSGGGSSGSTGKLSLESLGRTDSGSQNRSPAGSTVKSLSKTASRSESQSGSSHLTEVSSTISPASSISEWSSESTPSTSARTPTGSLQSHTSSPSALPRIGAASISPNAGLKNTKLAKSQSSKTKLVQSTQQTLLTKKQRPSLSIQAPSKATVKVSSVSRVSNGSVNAKSPLKSPNFQGRMHTKTGRERLLKSGDAAFKVHDISTLESPLVLQRKMLSENKSTADAPVTKFNPMKRILDAENINPSQ